MSSMVSEVVLKFRDNFSSGFKSATTNMSAAQDKVAKGAKEIQNGSGMMAVARDMSIVSMQVSQVTDQIQALTDIPSQVASSFEGSMARVNTVLNESNAVGGDTTASFEMIKASAERMAGGLSDAGKLASIGTDEFASSVYTMLSSGLNVEQGIAATEQASLLAKATGGNMGDAASALTGIYNNLGNKSAEATAEMTRLSDVVAGTQNYFAFENLQQFTSGLANVSGIAVSNKIPLTQLSAAIGQLNSNMITGPQAGTALKSVIAQLGNASKKMGFEIATASDGGLDLVKTFENIKSVGAGGAELIAAFGTEAGPAIGLLTENLGELKKGYDYVNNSAGVTLSNASKMSETLASKQENLNTAMTVWQGRMGEGSNAVKSFKTDMALAGVQILNFATSIPFVGEGLASIAGGAAEVTGSLAGMVNVAMQSSTGLLSMISLVEKAPAIMSTMSGGLGIIGAGFGKVKAGIVTALPGMGAWIASAWSVAAAHMAAAWPIYAIVAGVALLIAGVVLMVKHWDTVSVVIVGAWHKITEAFKTAFNFIKSIFTETPAIVQIALMAFAPWVAIPMQVIKHWDSIKAWFSAFVGWIVNIPGRMVTAFTVASTAIINGFKTAFNFIKSIFTETPAIIQIALMAFVPWVAIPMQVIKHWDSIKAWFSAFVGWIVNIPGRMVTAFTVASTAIINGFKTAFNFIKSIFTETPAIIQIALMAFVPWVAIPMQIIKHFDKIKDWFTSFVDFAKGIGSSIVSAFLHPIETVGGLFGKLFGKDSGKKITQTMASGMNEDTSLYNATSRQFNRVDRLIPHSNAPEGPFSRLTHAGKAIPETMASGMRGNKSLYNTANREFEDTNNILQFPGAKSSTSSKGVVAQIKELLGGGKSKGDVTNNYNVTVTFDELKELPSLIDYLKLLKEETDRVVVA